MPAHQWLAVESKLLGPLGCSQSEMSRPLGLSMLTKSKSHWQTIATDPGFQWISVISAATATLSERRVKQNCICVCLSVLGLMVHCSNQCLPSFDFPCAYTSYMDVYSLFKSSWFSFAPLYVPISPSHTTYAACFRSVLYLGSWSYSIWFHVSSRKMIALDSTIV